MKLARVLKEQLEDTGGARRLVVLNATGSLIDSLHRNGYDGALAFSIFETGLMKMVQIVPKDMDERRGIQDVMLAHIKKELQATEDEILKQRMEEDSEGFA